MRSSATTDTDSLDLATLALAALSQTDPTAKTAAVRSLREHLPQLVSRGSLHTSALLEPACLPGRPERPVLLSHLDVPQQSLHTPRGFAALIHAVCHIEFNAINLALDAVWRFAGMPAQYYEDWVRVASEEAYHFQLLRNLLQAQGFDYGDFAAHTGLWDMVERTKGDIVARMALVPRLLEARGLDATPPMQKKLQKLGTPEAQRAIEILGIILRDEIGHVAIGNRWYRWLCEREGLEPITHFRMLCKRHSAPRVRAPMNVQARRLAGFTDAELEELLSTQ